MDTRDLALFLPFRAALGNPNSVVGLPTLVWHFMRRKMTMGTDSAEISRASMDLYRSHQKEWDGKFHPFEWRGERHLTGFDLGCIQSGQWPCALPPQAYARCFS